MQESKEIKYYTDSKGIKTPLKDLHTEHLINGLGKRYKELFTSKNKDDYSKRLNEINDLKEEYFARANSFYEGLND